MRKNDDKAAIVNRFETEEGGEEHLLTEISEDTTTILRGELKSFFYCPLVNRHRGTLHLKLAIQSGEPMNRGEEQRQYLWPIHQQFNRDGVAFAGFDPVQEIHQFKIGALVGITSEFNEVDARKDIMKDAIRIYEE